MSLFGGAASQARSRNLVEFKAGKMNLRGNMVCYIKFHNFLPFLIIDFLIY
jgi:hypothetical protein